MNSIVASNKRVVNKPKVNQNKLTLDVQHNNYVQKLHAISQLKDSLAIDIQNIDRDISTFEKRRESVNDECEMDNLMDSIIGLKDKKLEIQAKIKDLNDKFNECSYYTNTANILFEYYDLIEKGNQPQHQDPAHASKQTPNAENSILKYFQGAGGRAHTPPKAAPMPPQDDMSHELESCKRSRGTLLEQYMQHTDPNYGTHHYHMQTNTIEEKCNHCASKNIIMIANDGYVCCMDCDSIEFVIVDHEKPSYKDPPKEISFYAYKRINHLNEWISQIQGKETTEIPEEVYDRILLEIKKQRITNMADVTTKKVRDILKKLRINKYYEHIPHIISRLNGNPIPQLSPELEDKLRNMFKQIQTPFVKYAPPKRKNFLSYSFCLHKFLQLLGEDHLLENFPLLKSRDKLHQQDQIWKKICEDLGWEFYRSI